MTKLKKCDRQIPNRIFNYATILRRRQKNPGTFLFILFYICRHYEPKKFFPRMHVCLYKYIYVLRRDLKNPGTFIMSEVCVYIVLGVLRTLLYVPPKGLATPGYYEESIIPPSIYNTLCLDMGLRTCIFFPYFYICFYIFI